MKNSGYGTRETIALRHLKNQILFLIFVMTCAWHARAAEPPDKPAASPNILLIAVDDLNDWVGALGGHPQAKTPNIDRLARQGTVFANAHCQAPICTPSRVSFMTGIRPSTTGLYAIGPLDFRRDCPALSDKKATPTMPEYFASRGYRTIGAGKIFHDSTATETFQEYGPRGDWGPFPPGGKKLVKEAPGGPLWDWGRFPKRDEDTVDYEIASWAIAKLGKVSSPPPFFMAVGFFRPHAPFYAPPAWWDAQEKKKDIILPPQKKDDLQDLGEFALALTYANNSPRHPFFEENGRWREAVQAYLASVSFVDAQIGRLLDALAASPYANNTIVVLLSDNGHSLGEKFRWGKRSLWERDTRVPLIIRAPGFPAKQRSMEPVGLIDVYPTLLELCGHEPRSNLEGSSLVPQLRDPATPHEPVVTTFFINNHAVRSRDYRYIRYSNGDEELYDHRTDPNEWHNLAGQPGTKTIMLEHARYLPKVNLPPLKGSIGMGVDPAHRDDWFGGVQ